MKAFLTEILAVDPRSNTGKLHRWAGTEILANDLQEAEEYCINNMGHLKIIGHCELEDLNYSIPEKLKDPIEILKRGIINPN